VGGAHGHQPIWAACSYKNEISEEFIIINLKESGRICTVETIRP
jgi:hypothetical protein